MVIILDSDDELLPTAATAIPDVAAAHPNAPLLFFRCENETGRLMEPRALPGPLPFSWIIVATRGHIVLLSGEPRSCPYDDDLRGHVSLAYFRMVERFGPTIISDAVVRLLHSWRRPTLQTGQSLARRRLGAASLVGNESAFPVGLLPACCKRAAGFHPPFNEQQKGGIGNPSGKSLSTALVWR